MSKPDTALWIGLPDATKPVKECAMRGAITGRQGDITTPSRKVTE